MAAEYYKKTFLKFLILLLSVIIPLSGCGKGSGGTSARGVVPESPANVQATDGAYSDRVTVTWDQAAGAASYSVYRSEGSAYIKIADGVTSLVYEDMTVSSTRPFTYYLYRVTSANSAGESGLDSSMTVTDQGYADPWSSGSKAPANLSATDGTIAGKIKVSWDAIAGVSSYRLYKSAAADGTYTLAKDNISDNSCTVNSVAGTVFWFKVSAVDAYAESAKSLPDAGHSMSLPPPPGSISASSEYFDHIHVVWNAATGEGAVSGYKIYGSDTADGTYVLLDTTGDLYFNEPVSIKGKVRYYRVASINEAGTGSLSAYVSGQTCGVRPPTDVTATRGTFTDRVTINWQQSEDAEGYRVYRADSANGVFTQVGYDLGKVLTFDDTTGDHGHHYFYRVSAFYYGGESVQSAYSEGWILAAPDQVTGVTASDGTVSGRIVITWSAPLNEAASYKIYKSASSTGDYSLLAEGITALNYTDSSSDLSGNGIHRYYKVRAVNAAGEGALSVCDEGSTMSVPSTPPGVSASGGDFTDRVRITWSASSGIVTSYTLYRYSSSDCSGTPSVVSGITSLMYDDKVANHSTYYYRVSAVNEAGESAVSGTVRGYTDDAPIPDVPLSVTASRGVNVASVHLSWGSVARASSYNIYRSSSSTGTYIKINTADITSAYYDDPAAAGVHWFYKVTAQNATGESPQSIYAEGWAMALAAQVTGLTSSGGTNDLNIAILWTAVPDALHYHIYRSATAGGTYSLIADDVTAAEYTDSSGLTAENHWFYRVSAVNPAGEGEPSAVYESWLVVSAPSGVSATQGTLNDMIRISWNPSVGATGYNIYRSSTENGTYTKITSSPATSSPYDDPDLLLPGNCWYKVTAVNDDGESPYSSSVEGWPYDDSFVIGTPGNVSASQGSFAERVTVTWNAASNAVYYNVFRSTSAGGTYTKINTSAVSVLTYNDSTVECSTHYFYRVSAVNGFGTESGQSSYSEGWATPSSLAAPTGVSATDGSLLSRIAVTWDAVSGASGYNVYRCSTSGGTYAKINTVVVTSASYTDTGLSAGVHWFYRVSSVSSGCGTESQMGTYNEGYAMTVPDIPSGISATDKKDAGFETAPPRCNATNAENGIDGVTVRWNAVNNAASYNVYRSDPAYDGSGTYGNFVKINTSPVTGTSFLDDYGAWDRNPSTFRRLINVYRYKVTAVNEAGESAQSGYDEGSAQITTAEFLNYMYDMPLRYTAERFVYEYGGYWIIPPRYKYIDTSGNILSLSGSEADALVLGDDMVSWFLTAYYYLGIFSGAKSDIYLKNYHENSYSQDFTDNDIMIFTDSIKNYNIVLNGHMRSYFTVGDFNGSGWNYSVNSNKEKYCADSPCTEAELNAASYVTPPYIDYVHTITVDNDCFGWVMLYAYTLKAQTKTSKAYVWVSYRGQKPIRIDKVSVDSYYNEYGCY